MMKNRLKYYVSCWPHSQVITMIACLMMTSCALSNKQEIMPYQQQPVVLPATMATPCEVPVPIRSNSGAAAIEALKVLYDQYGLCASKLVEIINYINEVNSGQR